MKLRNTFTGLQGMWPFDNRWSLVVSRIFFPNEQLLVYRKGDIEFLVDHAGGDHNGTRLCLISDIYTRFVPMMKLDSTISVFDLGANGGGFPLMLYLQGKHFSRLACVEMNPNTFARLQYNMTRNLEGDIALFKAAVCAQPKSFRLRFGRGSISDSIYQDGPESSDPLQKEYLVAGRTFDDLFESHFKDTVVDICKIDIEGAEYEVIGSSTAHSLRSCRYLLLEIHAAAGNQQAQLMENLRRNNIVPIDSVADHVTGERLFRNQSLT